MSGEVFNNETLQTSSGVRQDSALRIFNTRLFHTISQTNLLTENDIPASPIRDQVTDENVDCADIKVIDIWNKNNR